ncbi:TetR/AcrR family transcriptional regulator [Rhodococcus sp. USK10]|uniref:TetR/AcrR family transcriptional regulator n=1 Tax=Rhodococcus sp. USK10 TaxID=2789739 RepID=UPI001C5ED957|nr:TetR/AcrR family transcriptional regulator [Rhodococcus sp. USK10]QYB01515.1 TetR/AcrR family transcriptional regulator [Rhodococcus sp. USK10]
MRERRYSSTSPEHLAAALFDVAAESGLEGASVREVAKRAGVSIGAVQHHFSTKDEMFAFALRTLVDKLLTRLAEIDRDGDPAQDLFAAMSQLLPLDESRSREAHVRAAFAVRAATSPSLAEIRRTTLFTIRTGLSAVLIGIGTPEAETRAALLLATVDGLALEAIGSPDLYPSEYLEHALEVQIGMILQGADVAPTPSIELAS